VFSVSPVIGEHFYTRRHRRVGERQHALCSPEQTAGKHRFGAYFRGHPTQTRRPKNAGAYDAREGVSLRAVLTFMAQFGVGDHPGHANLLEPVVALVLAAIIGGLLLATLLPVVPRVRRAWRARIARQRRVRAAANAELRARAMMDELCPLGWRARITLFGASERLSDETPDPKRDWVALDWTAFEDESFRVSVVRRVWAPTITAALEAMVADRRTDETLQHIEQDALAGGAMWPDL
jgi:hypothetical protein